jgi:hypothetical protein
VPDVAGLNVIGAVQNRAGQAAAVTEEIYISGISEVRITERGKNSNPSPGACLALVICSYRIHRRP